jgi:NAD(P)-dependent dehydrogenase (short-subunit alcohol dehydrogenase family)
MAVTDRFMLTGKTAIVTGASSGLGVCFARALGQAGANVILAARRTELLEGVAASMEAEGSVALVQGCDVSDSASVEAMVEAGWKKFGRIDVLVNNAGVAAEAGFLPERTPDELWLQTINTNLNGLFWASREVGRRQLEDGKGGSIINVASVMGLSGHQNLAPAYQASKGAVVNLTRNLGVSWADRGVRVNCLAPGWFPSEMTNAWFAVPEFLDRFQHSAPMARIGDPDELVGALLFLASDASSFVTGQVLAVDGGYSAAGGTAGLYSDHLYAVQESVMGEAGTPIRPAVHAG